MKKVLCEGTTICYAEEGQGEHTVILLHGFCGSSAYWDDVVPLLSEACRCIVPDLRGHGRTDAPKGAYSIDGMADDVLKLMNELNITRAAVLGHSMGGYVALSLAERYPDQFSAVGLIHSTAHPDTAEAKDKRLQAVSTIENKGITAFIDGLVPGLFAPEHLEKMPDQVLKVRELGYKTPPQGASGAALAMRERPDRRDVLSATSLPVLLVAGEKDQLIPVDRTFTAEGPHVQHTIIAGAGHMSMLEAPAELAKVITGFVKQRIQ